MKKIITLLLVTGIIISIPLMEGCKKGDEDPFISILSRNARIKGTWKLISRSNITTTTTVQNTTNNINAVSSAETKVVTYRESFNGTTKTRYNYTTINSTDVDIVDNGSAFEQQTTLSENEYGSSYNYSYTVEITIEKNNTYTATYTETHVSTTTYSLDIDGNLQINTDEFSAPLNTDSWTSEGNWYWIDSNDSKIYIMTESGPLSGKLLKLSKKELIIEEISTSSNTSTNYYSGVSIQTFADYENPWESEDGTYTTVTTETVNVNDTETWEKQK